MRYSWEQLATLRDRSSFGFSNGGWAYDAYPELETLDAGRTITVAEIEGPAVITHIHCTRHFLQLPEIGKEPNPEYTALVARGIILEIYFDGVETPAVQAPLADFFADGCCGRAQAFSGPFIEKSLESYNCYIPMPFEVSARVVLRNETPHNVGNYSFVEWERLPAWNPGLGYFHATWKRRAFQLTNKCDEHFFHVDGRGHLLGRAWSISTDEDRFKEFGFVMEGNNEVRIDGESKPRADYLGSEDSFCFAWGWRAPFQGHRTGINFVQQSNPALLSVYEFRDVNVIPFMKSLDWRVDWKHEFQDNTELHNILHARAAEGGAWVDYATMHYWYQDRVGYPHEPLPPLEERVKTILKPNP